MRSSGRVTALATAFFLVAAVAALDAADGAAGLDRVVVVTGEDLVVLAAPEPAGWGRVELPDLDLALPALARDPPLVPPAPVPTAPPATQVLALMEVSDA
jgi:hypothetical protein